MPFSGDTFTKLYSWLTDPQRNEKIFNSRLDDEFGGIATGLTTLGGRSTAIESDVTEIETDITELSDAIAGLGGPAVAPACFFAHKNGTNQTGVADVTDTLVTFSTERYDVGNYFASNAWTPPAGKVSLTASVYMFSPTGGTMEFGNAQIFKNGSVFAAAYNFTPGAGGSNPGVHIEDIANGSDVYNVYGRGDVSSGTITYNGDTTITYFAGHWISA